MNKHPVVVITGATGATGQAAAHPFAQNPSAKMSVYAAGKAAQEALILTLAQELKDSGVTANIIHVRSIDVEGKGTGTSPAEIVAAMQYLCSEQAAKMTGARIPLY